MFFSRFKTTSPVILLLPVLGAAILLLPEPGRPAPGDSPRADERVFRQLFTRTDQDGKRYDLEELDPPLTPSSKFLTDGESHRQALAVLDEFLKGEPEKKMTPLQRAVLQHDLWAVLATTAGPAQEQLQETAKGRVQRTGRVVDRGDADLERPRQRRDLQRRLVGVMKRLALSPRDIDALPDNLADAVKAAAFPREFDLQRPEQPFLPADLADKDGAWLGFANWTALDDLAVPMHTAFVKGRSVFAVRLRLPAGRDETAPFSFQARFGQAGGPDPLETPKRHKEAPLLQFCGSCHARTDSLGGVHSLGTLRAGLPGESQGLNTSTDEAKAEATIRWTRKTYTWGLLQGLWEAQPSKE
jgi:hypothetical protein